MLNILKNKNKIDTIELKLTLSCCTSLQISDIVIVPSVTLIVLHFCVNDKIESLVIPGNIKPFNGGVINSLSTHKHFF